MRLKCSWEYDGNASFVEFHVRWIGDEMDPNRRIEQIFNGTDEKVFLYEHEYAGKGNFDYPDAHEYAFNKEVCCIFYVITENTAETLYKCCFVQDNNGL